MTLEKLTRNMINHINDPSKLWKNASIIMGGSIIVGYLCNGYVERKKILNSQLNHDQLNQSRNNQLGKDEALVRAIVDEARSSSWRVNLENALVAQEYFMRWKGAGGEGEDLPKFVQKIINRRDHMLEKDQIDHNKRYYRKKSSGDDSFN